MSMTHLTRGRVFAGDFRVIALIAEGGMGTVYEVEQISTHKRRALKLVRAPLASDDKAQRRFVQEATIGASIDSAHIVEVIAAGIDRAQPWLAMELLTGADLGALVQHHGTLTVAQLLETFRQLCHGLGAAHRAGVVHRDLKPANIFVTRPKRVGMPFTVKILDFGIAKVVEGSKSGATKTETVGSPMWMAPEQLDARRPSPATDVWALGLIAFYVLTGKHYWRAAHKADGNVQALFVEQLFKPIDPATMRAAEYDQHGVLPPGFDAWFARCTVRDEAERFVNADAAFDGLAQAIGALDPAATQTDCAALIPDETLAPSTATHAVHTEPTTASQGSSRGIEETEARTGPVGADASRLPLSVEAVAPKRRRGSALLVAGLAAVVAAGAVTAWWFAAAERSQDVNADAAAEDRAPLPDPTQTESEPEPTSADGAAREPDASESTGAAEPDDPPQAPDEDQAELAALQLVVPMRTQLGHIGRDVDFRGWTPDGARFVVAVTRADDEPSEGHGLSFRLIQVHDAITGVMIESYLTQEDGTAATRSKRSRAIEEARGFRAWRARATELALLPPRPRREGPNEAIAIEALLGEPAAPSTAEITASTRGFQFRWSGLTAPPRAEQADAHGPGLELNVVIGEARWPMLDSRVPFTFAELAARLPDALGQPDPPAVVGRIDLHWSPDGQRVVVVVESQLQPARDDAPRRDARFYLRGAGPQIRITEAGAGQGAARNAAVALGRLGLPIAGIDLREPPVAESKVLYRRRHTGAKALAERLAAARGEALSVSEGAKGWSSAVLVLGHDAVR